MRLLLVFAVLFWVCVALLAVRMLAVAQSPPAAYAGAFIGVAAIAALCLSLIIIWLVGA